MNVQLPDGRVVEFPDSMKQNEIEAALAGLVPAQAAPATTSTPPAAPLSPWARVPLGLGAAAASGVASTLELPGRAENLMNAGADWLSRQFGIEPGAGYPQVRAFPAPEAISAATNRLGITNNPLLAPQSEVERLGQATAAGVGSAVPLLPLGGPLGLLAGGGAGGAAGEAARALGAPEPIQAAAGIGAGLGVQGLVSALSRGIPHIAADLGTSATLQEAGEFAQDAARRWLTKVPAGESPIPGTLQAKLAETWEPVTAAIPRETPVGLNNYRAALDSITTRAGALASSEKALRPALPERLKELLEGAPSPAGLPPMARPRQVRPGTPGISGPTVGPGSPVSSGRMISGGGGPISWQDLSRFRSTLGDAMADPRTVKEAGSENLSRLYAAVTEDMREAAVRVNPSAAALFDAANAESARLYGIAQGPVAKLVSGPRPSLADDPKPGEAASRLLSGARRDATDLAALRSEIPEAVDELAAAHLRLNPDAKAWARLAPEAQQVLVPAERDRRIIAGTFQPKIPKRDLVERSVLDLLIGAYGAPLIPGINPAAAAVIGAATPYMVQGARSAVRNPLYGTVGGFGAEANPLLAR